MQVVFWVAIEVTYSHAMALVWLLLSRAMVRRVGRTSPTRAV